MPPTIAATSVEQRHLIQKGEPYASARAAPFTAGYGLPHADRQRPAADRPLCPGAMKEVGMWGTIGKVCVAVLAIIVKQIVSKSPITNGSCAETTRHCVGIRPTSASRQSISRMRLLRLVDTHGFRKP